MSARPAVLIVDDDRALAENIADLMTTLDVEVTMVHTGAEALAAARAGRVDVAFVDVRLPDMVGLDLAREIKRAAPQSETVLVTGYAAVEAVIEALRHDVFAFVLKPFAAADLLDTARGALEQVALYRERERLRGELERSEREHRELVEAIPAFVLALDDAGRITFWNRRLEDTTGFSRQEMLGTSGLHLLESPTDVHLLPRRQGPALLVRWERAATNTAAAGIYAVGIDVTADQELRRRTVRAERLAAVGTLAAGLAHEVRNPLNSALLQLQVLARRLDRPDSSPEALRAPLAMIEGEIHRLERLVDDFLSFARPRPLELRAVDPAALLRDVLELVRPETEAKNAQLRAELAADAPALRADPERLKQVLLNLIRNALEATAATPEPTLTLRLRRADADAIEIDVEDNGPGFPEEAPIFDAFFTTKPQGTGLGLTIVHRIVGDHGGTVGLRSRAGETCFTVRLPVAP